MKTFPFPTPLAWMGPDVLNDVVKKNIGTLGY